MEILTSKSLINYYSNTPDDYTIKYHHYNIIVNSDSKEEYKKLEKDIKYLREINQDSSIIYFSDLDNIIKVKNNTNILNNSSDIYLRIRNNEEYSNYKLTGIKSYLIIELEDLKNINLKEEEIVIQIDNISELSIEKLINLRKTYNIKKVLVGQIRYITSDYDYLLDILSKQFNIDINNQLELEKNNEVTNDMYDIDTYINIVNKINTIIKQCEDEDTIKTINNIFDFIATTISYDNAGVSNTNIESQNLIGALFNKKSVCEGYSKLFKQILSLIGIESIIVSGGGHKTDGGHVWNQVKINDSWYNADVSMQNFSIQNNLDYQTFLVCDNKCRYKSNSPFAHKCDKDFFEEKQYIC